MPIELKTPIDEDTIRGLKVGDTVEIMGRIYTGRDAVHHRLHEGEALPVDLAGAIIYHCGPVMVEENGGYVCKAAGPTTSAREEPYQHEVMRDHGIRAVIGKGGMGPKTLKGCQDYGCVYLHAIGGAAQVCAQRITRVDGVDWLDLGCRKPFGTSTSKNSPASSPWTAMAAACMQRSPTNPRPLGCA